MIKEKKKLFNLFPFIEKNFKLLGIGIYFLIYSLRSI